MNLHSRPYAIQLHVYLTPLVLEENILLVTFVHKLSLTMKVKETFVKASKVIDKPSNVKIDIRLCVTQDNC